MRQRLFQVLRTVGAVTLLGLLYVLWGGLTRLWLPCPFHLLTGLDCPGCGVTRMCRALLRLDPSAAWAANPGMLVLSPLLLGLFFWHAITYIRIGNRRFTRGQSFLCWTLVVLFLFYGILRNLL